ncbi:terpene synthase family protein [Chryseobacterium sp. 22543]|uniref:terpene synthase family protein n=1 Tax=Chryseobacterium sp. 22543 TaxID=3453940 RepID=UPI003F8692A8
MSILTPTHVVTIPGSSRINSNFESIQNDTLKWAQHFELSPHFKPLKWYSKARFGLQAAREYPEGTYPQIALAGDLLTWLFTVDDACDRGSADQENALFMRELIKEFIAILKGDPVNPTGKLSVALIDLLSRFRPISSPFLFGRYCKHMADYLTECLFEIKMQLDGETPDIARYYRERPFTGFYIMFPLVGIFEQLNFPDEVYLHPTVQNIELCLNLLGCLSNDLHSVDREGKLEKAGFNLIFIAQTQLGLTTPQAINYVIQKHAEQLQKYQEYKALLPDWGEVINTQLDRYIGGLYTIVRGYDDWAIIDTGRYESI